MPHVIDTDTCITCGVCADTCPNVAIEDVDGEFVIDPDKCNDCATCADECPEGAISPA